MVFSWTRAAHWKFSSRFNIFISREAPAASAPPCGWLVKKEEDATRLLDRKKNPKGDESISYSIRFKRFNLRAILQRRNGEIKKRRKEKRFAPLSFFQANNRLVSSLRSLAQSIDVFSYLYFFFSGPAGSRLFPAHTAIYIGSMAAA